MKAFIFLLAILPISSTAQLKYVDVVKFGSVGCVKAQRRVDYIKKNGTPMVTRTDLFVIGSGTKDDYFEMNEVEMRDFVDALTAIASADYSPKGEIEKQVHYKNMKISAKGYVPEGEREMKCILFTLSEKICVYKREELLDLIKMLQRVIDYKDKS